MLRILVGLLAMLWTVPAAAGDANSFAVRDVRVFDGERVLPHRTVIVRDGRIAAIGVRLSIPKGVAVVEGKGRTLIPGLIDAHVHVIPGAQRDALRFGVTTELDMFTMAPAFPAWRSQRESRGQVSEADTWSAGMGVSAPGGHPSRMLPPDYPMPTLAEGADTKAFVAARIAEGSDYVKIILERTGLGDPPAKLPALSHAAVCAAIAAAHAGGRKAIVHISAQADARAAIACGADGLAHLFSDSAPDPAFLREAARSRAWFATTLSVMGGVSGLPFGTELAADPRVVPFLSAAQKRTISFAFPTPHPQTFPRALAAARALHAIGVPLLAGTDAPGPGTAHGVSLHGELQLLVRAGFTPLRALAAATWLPARHFGLSDRGRIAAGYRADLVLLDGDPTARIADTLSIAAIWKNGYPVDRKP